MNPEMVLAMSAILKPVETDKLVGPQRGGGIIFRKTVGWAK